MTTLDPFLNDWLQQEKHNLQPTTSLKRPYETNAKADQPNAESSEVVQDLSQSLLNDQIGEGDVGHFFQFEKNLLDQNGALKIYENSSFEVIIMKSYHKRQTNFKFEDAMFQIKINIKDETKTPFIKDILDVIQSIINFALSSLKSFVNASFDNICYLTLFQTPMLRGIKSAPFNLTEGYVTGTSNLLGKLNRYLVSNNELTLNESFILYVNILSLTHAQLLKKKKKAVRFGASDSNFIQNYWCIDVATIHEEQFKNKCLILCCILADLQFKFFLSGKTDKRFIYASMINNKAPRKKSQAVIRLNIEIRDLLKNLKISTDDLQNGLNFDDWKEKLSSYFNCQFTIFTGREFSSKILLMYPEKFDDTKKQFYFYCPNQNPNHLAFIRHLGSYFKNNVMTCNACKKVFKSHMYKHLCKAKANCFSCRKPIQSHSTFICPVLQDDFCDSAVTQYKFSTECAKCNLIIKSQQCMKSHLKLCGSSSSKGKLGFQCKKCNKFFYKNGSTFKNSEDIAKKHTCGEVMCRYCKVYYDFSDTVIHLCKLKKEYLSSCNESLVFLSFAALNNSSYNCVDCFSIQNAYIKSNNISWKDLVFDAKFSELSCPLHTNNWYSFEPNALCIYKQSDFNLFTKYNISEYEAIKQEDLLLNLDIPFKQNKDVKLTEDFQLVVKQLSNLESLNVMDKFLKLILNNDWSNYTFILSDPFGFFLKHLTSILTKHGICPKLINDVGKIILLEITQLKIRFVTTEMYHFDQALQTEIMKKFAIKDHFFPYSINKPENYSYIGQMPTLNKFIDLSDSESIVQKKTFFFNNHNVKNWSFVKELDENLNHKCFLLSLQCADFIRDSIQLQNELQSLVIDDNPNKGKLINPFHKSLCSFSGYIFKLFKAYFLFNEDIYAIHDEYGLFQKKTSKDEILWAHFMTFEHPELNFRHQFNHPKGQKMFDDCIPDLYSPITKEVWFFNGCYWHGHIGNDCLSKSKTQFNKRQQKTFQTLNQEFEEKIKKFNLKNPDSKINCVWECHFAEIKKSRTFTKFLKSGYALFPLNRLRPRTTVRGGYNQIYHFAWNNLENKDEDFFCLDINGLYSYCAINFPSVYGKYDILIGHDLSLISYDNNEFFYNNKKIYGSVHLTILPPDDLFLPYLMYRNENNKNVLTLCRKCSETNNNLITVCSHSIEERALTSSYMIAEIEFALSLGYKILKIHEVHAYYTQKFILRDFVKCIDSLKLRYSDFPVNSDKAIICDEINNELNLPPTFQLKPELIENNKVKKSLYKLATNSLFGKLQQRSDFSKTIFVASQHELEEFYQKNHENIDNIACHSDIVCQIDYRENLTSKTRNLKQNCYLGAEITSNARIVMYKHLQQLNETNGIRLFYCDTDSIFGAIKKDQSPPLKIGNLVGQFKKVVKGEVTSFYCLGLKNYCLTYINENGQKVSQTKLCGLNLNNVALKNTINESLYESYVQNFLLNIENKTSYPKIKRPKLDQISLLETFTFSNNIVSDRQINKELMKSFPCGYFKTELNVVI
jgi:G:T-mismatch repair DNA endonuclease (very short patch repair protein)